MTLYNFIPRTVLTASQLNSNFADVSSSISGVSSLTTDHIANTSNPHNTTSAQTSFVQSGTGAVSRSAQSKMRDVVSVKDFGAVGDGVTNDSPAFQSAVNSIANGLAGVVFIPPGLYNLFSPILNNGRIPTFICDPGAGFTSEFPNTLFEWPTRIERYNNRISTTQNVNFGTVRENGAMNSYNIVGNIGTVNGFGDRVDYFSNSYGEGFDIANGIICSWDRSLGQNGGQVLTQWLVARSPQVGNPDSGFGSTNWGAFVTELNIVNRHADHGWSKSRPVLSNWTGIMQLVPEGNTLGAPGNTYDVLYGILLCRSTDNKSTDGFPARLHNGILIEPDSITAAGRGIYASGRNLLNASQTPVAMLELDDWWQRGISTRRASFTTNVALGLGASHTVAWLDGSDAVTNGIYSGTGSPESVVTARVGSIFLRRDGAAGTTLYVKQSGTGNTGWVGK